ncbi:MAG TPA: hypothetical protein VFM28_06420, partial [Nitrososphaeraceae archaeon]|nr:hypothetical protein [Nitrososphaeraceae archaeon]
VSSKSVDINKIKCINTNLNINGNNTGDINLGNKGQVAAEGYSGAYSSGGGGYGGAGYYDGNYKKDKDITCIINNNNNNTNIVAGVGGGNLTDGGDGNVTDPCEECFLDALGSTNLTKFETYLANLPPMATYHNLEEYCSFIQSQIAIGQTPATLAAIINANLGGAGIILEPDEITSLVNCLIEALSGGTDNNGSLAPFDINTHINTDTTNTDTSDFGPMITLPTP